MIRDPMLDTFPMWAGDTSLSMWGPPDQHTPRLLTIYEVAERDRREAMARINEGDPCPTQCGGTMVVGQPDDCSCHISPPCAACTDRGMWCEECGWMPGDEIPAAEGATP